MQGIATMGKPDSKVLDWMDQGADMAFARPCSAITGPVEGF